MRRPLAWIVALSLTVLFAHRPPVAPVPENVTSLPHAPRVIFAATETPSPFAYVREDGSQQFVPATGEPGPSPSFEDLHAVSGFAEPRRAGEFETAAYTWSTPVESERLVYP
jgi:hypothetical protein